MENILQYFPYQANKAQIKGVLQIC